MIQLDKNLNSNWEPEEWAVFSQKLENLSEEDLREIIKKTDLSFANPIETISKKEIILVLDEIDREFLISQYEKFSGKKWSWKD